MIRIYILILIFIIRVVSYSQTSVLPQRPYEKISFEGLNPVWHETCFDPAFIGGDTCDGYNLYERSFYEDVLFEYPYFYKIHHRWGVYQANGTYIQKRNIETGELVWQTYYGLPVDERQEFGRLLYINAQDQLEVISLLKRTPYMDPGDFFTSYVTIPSKRIYDKHSGTLLFAELPEVNDTTLFHTNFSVWSNYNKFFRKNTDSLIFYKLDVKIDNGWFFNHEFTPVSINIKKDEINSKKLAGNDRTTRENLIRLHENEYLLVEIGDDSGQAVFLYLDSTFNLKEKYFSEPIGINISSLKFRSYDPVRKTILLTYEHPQNGINSTPQDILVLNRYGKIIRRGSFKAQYTQTYEILTGNDHSDFKILANGIGFDENKKMFSFLDVLDWKEDSFHVVKRYYAKDSLRIFADFQIHQVTPDHYLINGWERSYFYDQAGFAEFDIFSSAISWMYIKASDLITVNTTNIQHDLPCKLYPIPAHDRLTIEFDTPVTGKISIYDMLGRYVHTFDIENVLKTETDLSFLQQGSYVLYLENKKLNNNKMQKLGLFFKI